MNLGMLVQQAAAIVVTFGMVIFLHEAGHFFMCRWLGVRVERFAFGFGPELLGITGRSGTRFSICLFPLGGFVKPAGEDMENTTGKADEYFAQSWSRRLAIVYAGPIMNYVLAFVLFTGVIWIKGAGEPGNMPIIGNMMTGFPADNAGLQLEDKVLSVNGKAVATWEELAGQIHKHPAEKIKLVFERGAEKKTVEVATKKDEASGRGVIGIMPKLVYKPVGFFAAAYEGGRECYALTAFTIKTIGSKIWKREKPDLAGPVGIVQMVSRAAKSGLEDLINLIGLISVAIGFFNFLPVPLLDGGHGAMYIWEGLSGKPLTKESVARANTIGIAFLVSLLVFATYNDLMRIRAARQAKAAAVQPQ
jgi:regulator of sigma E protease